VSPEKSVSPMLPVKGKRSGPENSMADLTRCLEFIDLGFSFLRWRAEDLAEMVENQVPAGGAESG